VKQIKIKLSTNMNKETIDLTFSKIYDPAPGDRSRKILISEYPFFTADVEYDEKFLQSKPYYEILNVFFDKKQFIKAITKNTNPPTNIPVTTDPVKIMKNANENIMIMLRLLFPISHPTKNNLNTSYRKYFLNQPPSISLGSIDVTSMFSSGEITPMGKRTYSYLKMQGGICTVSEVIWLNDVLNNKLYRELIDKIIEYTDWKEKQTIVIDEDIKKVSDKLLNGLTASGTGTGTGELFITANDRDELANQKRIYNPDDIKKDMMDIIKKYLTIDTDPVKSAKLDEELGFMIDYFIDTNIKGSASNPITQFVRLKDKFDFTYTNSQGKSDLFVLHKRYDGADKAMEIRVLTAELPTKQVELYKLTDGYVDTPSHPDVFVFGQLQLTQYIDNLNDAIVYMNDNGVSATVDTIKTRLKNILEQQVNYPSGMVRLIVTSEDAYTVVNFTSFDGRSIKKTGLSILSNRLENAKAYLKTIEEKIQKLNAEIAVINSRVRELSKPNPNIFVFKGETDVPPEPIATLKRDNADDITKMQEEIFKKVITRYNRFQDTRNSPDLRGQYAEIDTDIDIIVDELIKLENEVNRNALNNTTVLPKTILDITVPIKKSFDKLVAGNKISISRTIGDKLTKIINLSNDIQFYTQLQSIFFKPTTTGIFVDYEKSLDPNDIFTKKIIAELTQQKYANFKKMIDYIRERFLKNEVTSLNDQLTKIMAKYFKNESNDFYDSVVFPANQLINSGIKQDFLALQNLWDISVTSLKSTKLENEYEISVYMELIEGELNSKNKSEIKCQYLNDELIRRFEELMDEEPSYGPPVNPKAFSIAKAKEEVIKHKQEQKEELDSALHSNAKKAKVNPSSKGGRKLTKSYRSSKQNYTRKLQRTLYS
jgi:hypothetical protein